VYLETNRGKGARHAPLQKGTDDGGGRGRTTPEPLKKIEDEKDFPLKAI